MGDKKRKKRAEPLVRITIYDNGKEKIESCVDGAEAVVEPDPSDMIKQTIKDVRQGKFATVFATNPRWIIINGRLIRIG
ncbi:MAG: hypothetical protein D6B25_10940 [Desulfobulbaceae bacterium]|nr:MAG: hypothetical protein D6B25_10940 [Desulfobulbaceae bacterium]